MTYEVHPAAALFPMISGQAFEELVNDIKLYGQMEPIILDKSGQLIDGRNRARACERLGILPKTKVYDGDDVLQFVVSHNLHRRHLTDSQRAMIAARLAERKPGYRRETAHLSMGEQSNTGLIPPSLDEAADLLDVKRSTVATAKRVIRDGTPALQELTAEGGAAVTTAARVSELPAEEQDAYVEQVRAGANPIKAAPPDLKQQEQKARKQPRDPNTVKKADVRNLNSVKPEQLLRNITQQLAGLVIALEPVDLTDWTPPDADEAALWRGDLDRGIKSLNRLRNQLKEK